MKCDHLLGRMFDGEVYILASDVMEAVSELKQKLQDNCIHCPVKEQEDDVVAELKAKLENVQASMYADVVDANMEVMRLKEERRWRKCNDEMPKVEEGYGEIFLVAVETESNTTSKGSYVTIAEFCDGEWYNDVTGNEIEENIEREDCFYHSRITYWMPLPSAPKEAK